MGRPLKPETDPDWEERAAKHRAKRQRREEVRSARAPCEPDGAF